MINKKNNFGSFNLVIGIAAPYGAGASSFSQEVNDSLANWPGIKTSTIRVAELIKKYHKYYIDEELNLPDDDNSKRRKLLQTAGTQIRLKDRKATAKLVVAEVVKIAKTWEKNHELVNVGTSVFIIDCLKNGNEVSELRRVYGDEFYLIYIHASRENRWRREVDYKGWRADKRVDFERRDKIDYNEKSEDPDVEDAGQEVQKLSTMADYYVVNNFNREKLKSEAERFLDILFGNGENQPTMDERSIHMAFSASNRSFCLSRQVGAAIVDDDGNIIGVGHNDVPKPMGGLYTQENGREDKRCYLVGDRRCINDTNKQERFFHLENELLESLSPDQNKEKMLKKIIYDSAFKELTEFCRAVHAEMEALLSVCRTGSGSTLGATMYVTAQPCHNCIKHIICAGIKKVIYLEPYPKSLGLELHSDAIELDPSDDRCLGTKLILTPYGGVAPHRYHDFFVMRDERKSRDGQYLNRTKLQQSKNPRFAADLAPRTRKTLDPLYPNLVTANELVYLNEIGSMVKDFKKTVDDKD